MNREELENAFKYIESVESDFVDLMDEVQEMEVMITRMWKRCRNANELLKASKAIIEWELNKEGKEK